ncbi:TetR/AcrR family transcriptional regulator [Aliiglaciecola sp. 3_MG-2023]|uniref:TetR/AcrR family transcriptional regulator n=1 Tax=Aliiglaciecola sp. 3_MG-2023 TaxID=3062644 RepID=UPI0026E15E90|nr:TetR/AcrR family transcriptional regulator [Aliiglaciecola sp. 3_MG-2023]MDO6695419.1 TetR/AcrR family transcriptional regulator [Aliiglaciecola sp. 3_MG-2023]
MTNHLDPMTTLQQKKMEFTRNLILDAACELTHELDVDEISFKKVAQHANISERTIFRYFESRDTFLNELTALLYQQLALPMLPTTINQLPDYISHFYTKLDSQPRQVLVLLKGEVFQRVLSTTAKQRLTELTQLLTEAYPHAAEQEIVRTAANIRYNLSASSWRYYRVYFEFDLKTCIECTQMLVAQSLQHLHKVNLDTN